MWQEGTSIEEMPHQIGQSVGCWLFSWLWIDVPGSSPEWAVPPLGKWSRGVQEKYKKGGWMWAWQQGSELLSSGPTSPPCSSSFLLWCPQWQAIIRSTLSSRVAFGHGVSRSKGEQLRQQLSVQRRGEAKMLSLLHHCAGTLSPEKAASLPPESFPIFSTPPNGTITHSFRWGWEKQWQEVKRIQFRTKKFPVKAELIFFKQKGKKKSTKSSAGGLVKPSTF